MIDISHIKTFVVVGSGTMGREIAQVALMAGFDKVIINSRRTESVDRAEKYIFNKLKELEIKGKLGEGVSTESLMANLIKETDLEKALANSDFVVESIPEILERKQEIFEKMGKFCPERTILASNTSTMPITKIGERSGRPEKIVGMHFFIPIPVLTVIELIKGEKTSQETMDISFAVGEKLPSLKGKRFVVRIEKETPGFIVNRLTIGGALYQNLIIDEAFEKGIPWEDIDADTGGLHQWGPLAKMDYLGLDVNYHCQMYFAEALSPDFTPGKVFTKLIKEGNFGKKTGKGFYEWNDKGEPILKKGKKAGLFDPEIYMAIQLNEGCRLLEEGVVSGYKIIDDVILGAMSMPGPFSAGKKNYEKWSKMLEELAEKSGKNYLKPCNLMKTGGFIKMR